MLSLDAFEIRMDDRPYDEVGVTHVRHPNGSLMATQHRGLAGALVKAAYCEQPGTGTPS